MIFVFLRSESHHQLSLACGDPTTNIEHLNKLRQLLGAGQRAEAIECAIKCNMWPHAMFLASSTSSATGGGSGLYSANSTSNASIAGGSSAFTPAASSVSLYPPLPNPSLTSFAEPKALVKVKLRFVNSLPAHDPIHTCYQLLVGRVPTIATNLAKAEWNDWRRHLAIIVSNVDEANKELVANTIKTMGDTVLNYTMLIRFDHSYHSKKLSIRMTFSCVYRYTN